MKKKSNEELVKFWLEIALKCTPGVYFESFCFQACAHYARKYEEEGLGFIEKIFKLNLVEIVFRQNFGWKK